MKTLRITLFAAVIAAFFTGCAGPEGPTGATGPQGPQGVNGSYLTGTSNPGDWSVSGNFLIASYSVSIIDANAEANGVIMVYFESSGNWAPLPYTYIISSSLQQTWTFNYNIGIVTLQIQNSDLSTPSTPGVFNFKVVVIPTAVIKQHPGLNVKDYNMVMQVLQTNKANSN